MKDESSPGGGKLTLDVFVRRRGTRLATSFGEFERPKPNNIHLCRQNSMLGYFVFIVFIVGQSL